MTKKTIKTARNDSYEEEEADGELEQEEEKIEELKKEEGDFIE